MDVREKTVGLNYEAEYHRLLEKLVDIVCDAMEADGCIGHCNHPPCFAVERVVNALIANGVTVQDNMEISDELLERLRKAPVTVMTEEPTVEPVQEWISVKDRLPNVDTNKSGYERKGVIVCVDGCSKKSVYRVYERACNRGKTVYRWKYPWDTISDENITHWCELPQPPKGE